MEEGERLLVSGFRTRPTSPRLHGLESVTQLRMRGRDGARPSRILEKQPDLEVGGTASVPSVHLKPNT
jgi:hypothetical protein